MKHKCSMAHNQLKLQTEVTVLILMRGVARTYTNYVYMLCGPSVPNAADLLCTGQRWQHYRRSKGVHFTIKNT